MLFGALCISSNLVADGRLLTNHPIILHASHSCSLDERNIDHVVHVYPFDVYSICLRIFFLPVRYSFTNLIWFVVFFNMFFLNLVCCINHPSRCSFKKLVISGSDKTSTIPLCLHTTCKSMVLQLKNTRIFEKVHMTAERHYEEHI